MRNYRIRSRHVKDTKNKRLSCKLLCLVLLFSFLSGCAPVADAVPTWERCVVQVNYDWYQRFTEFYVISPSGELAIYSVSYTPINSIDSFDALFSNTLAGCKPMEIPMLTQQEWHALSDRIAAITPAGVLREIPQPEELEALKLAVDDGTLEVTVWLDGQTASFYDNVAIRAKLKDYPQEAYREIFRFVMAFLHEDYENSMETALSSFGET